MPNAFIVPIGPGGEAREGDIVLSARASGGDLARAVVVGGSPKEPRVRYLTDPRGANVALEEEQLPANTFRRLGNGDVGTSVACLEEGRRVERLVVGRANDRLLGLGFGGALAVRDALACQPVPLVPRAEIGARIYVPIVGVYRSAKVIRTDVRIGRVWASYDFAGKQAEAAFSFGDVADDLELPDRPKAGR
jgi:hypothetical protein